MKNILNKLHRRVFAGLARKDDLDALYAQIAGLQQIQNAMDARPILRPMRGWAISPDAMALVLADLQDCVAPTVIEFGSGQSTVILASALKRRGGCLISVEHDADYSAGIQRQLEACGLADVVNTRHLPLVPIQDQQAKGARSYDLQSLPPHQIDVALIDGPPGIFCGPETRLVPLRWCVRNLAPNGSIFLDDSNRPAEQKCLSDLKRDFPDIAVTQLDCEKGLTRIRLRSQ
jgi:predicted O-methyltransferase YrrM